MYCVIGEKVLKCEVKKKEETSSICKVGTAKKEQVISNNRLFETHEEATKFMNKRKTNKVNENKLITNAVEKCTAMYEPLDKDTGIEVRTIDRQWTVASAEKHINKLIRTLSDKPETFDKNVSKSFSMAPEPKKNKSDKRGSKNFKLKDEKKSGADHKKKFDSDNKKKFVSDNKKKFGTDHKKKFDSKRVK